MLSDKNTTENVEFKSPFTTQVGIGDLKYIQNTGTLKTLLGSCVGILLVEPTLKLAGLLHILLPFPGDPKDTNKLKYATTGIPLLLSGMRMKGAKHENIYAKIAGGAEMFTTKENSIMAEIGSSNSNTVIEILNKNKIKITGSDIGGKSGRIIMFSWPEEKTKISIIGTNGFTYII